ncbi:MAG: ribosome small subunit-dependent GTPase A [Quisquiliibacterium sp.]
MINATVIAAFGRQSLIRSDQGEQMSAVARGRSLQVAVGDHVQAVRLGAGQAVIEGVSPRSNEFKRSDIARTKWLASNLDQAAVVIEPSPPYSEDLLLRVMIAGRAEGIELALIVNKRDLADASARIEPRLAVYRALGYQLIECSAKHPEAARDALMPWLLGRTTLLLGQSGMGKSTLINCLVPDAGQRTREISQALASGKHTTSFTRMFALGDDDSGRIIDSPGFQAFGLEHLSSSQRTHAMPEYAPLLGACRFHNCTHRTEPGCAIRAACEDGRIDSLRYQLFARLTDESESIARSRPRKG